MQFSFRSNRPVLNIKPSPQDTIIELACIGLLIISWIYAVIQYPKLPTEIPTHYTINGVVDGFGPKSTIWILPAVGTGIVLLLSFVNRYPHLFNYPVQITTENAGYIYTKATKLIRYLKFGILLIFLTIEINSIRLAQTGHSFIGGWFAVAVAILLFLPTIVFVYNVFGATKKRR